MVRELEMFLGSRRIVGKKFELSLIRRSLRMKKKINDVISWARAAESESCRGWGLSESTGLAGVGAAFSKILLTLSFVRCRRLYNANR